MELNDIEHIKSTIPENVTLVAATKYVDASDMKKLLKSGIHHFGENRVDSFLEKKQALKDEAIVWHFIGHLQRNKAKLVLNKIDYLHSLDSLELAKIIEEERVTPLNCFVEVSLNHEESKNGVPFEQLNDFIKELLKFNKVHLVGLMCMTKEDSTPKEKYQQFKALAYLKDRLNYDFNLELKELSMGMSEDYLEAIKAGTTMVRLGRILWKQDK